MIDTHAHLNFKEFDKDLDNVVQKSFSEGIEEIIIPGSTLKESLEAIKIAERYENIFAAVGIHPEGINGIGDFSEIEKLAGNKEVVAIGETGLDYSYPHAKSQEAKVKQRELLERHIGLAEKVDLPLILHNRDSDDDFYNIIKNYKGDAVLHCYSGDWSFAKKILDLGYLISFTGIVTFDKTGKLEEVIRKIPIEKVMVETDSPYLAPVPYRGRRAEPWMVREIIKKIASIKGLSTEEVDRRTTTTAKNFFGI